MALKRSGLRIGALMTPSSLCVSYYVGVEVDSEEHRELLPSARSFSCCSCSISFFFYDDIDEDHGTPSTAKMITSTVHRSQGNDRPGCPFNT
jgi:hypothetical protein